MHWWDDIVAPASTVTVIACGARDWADCAAIPAVLEPLRNQYPMLTVIEGGAKGADQCAAQWAADAAVRGVGWRHIPARWDDYEANQRWKAGHDRNEVMLNHLLEARDAHHQGVAVVAFKASLDPRLYTRPNAAAGGTEDMIRRAWGAGIPTFLVRAVGRTPRLIQQVADSLF